MKFEGNGPLGKISAESDGYGHVRGTVKNSELEFQPGIEIHKQIRDSIGIGVLSITKDLGLKTPYTGSVHITSGEIGEDIAYYLLESEQIPSVVAVTAIPSADGKGVDVAGGYLIQSIPSEGGNAASDEANLESITQIVKSLPPLNELISRGNTPENIIAKLMVEVPYKIIDTVQLSFTCSCAHDVMRRALKIAGKEEVGELIKEENGAVLTCQFCKKEYSFTHSELEDLHKELN
jgi:molecular chaperone Hsp33